MFLSFFAQLQLDLSLRRMFLSSVHVSITLELEAAWTVSKNVNCDIAAGVEPDEGPTIPRITFLSSL